MAWLARLLSPGKRRPRNEGSTLPPSKKLRTLEADIFAGKAPALAYPFKKKDPHTLDSEDGRLGLILSSVLIPRPLILVASLDHNHTLTVAPSTYCTVVSEDPAYISIALSKENLPADSLTDAVSSVIDSREFTVNVVSEWLVDRAAKAAGSYKNFDPDTNADLAKTGITTSPSEQVAVPRITESAATLECVTKNRLNIKDRDGEVASVVVIAEVVGLIVERQITKFTPEGETGIDTAIFKPVAVLGGDQGAQITNFYPLALEALESVNDPTPPTGPAASDRETGPSEVVTGASGGIVDEGVAVAVATAVAEALEVQPDAPAVEEVQVTLRESSEAGPARSNRSANREATPISVVVQAAD